MNFGVIFLAAGGSRRMGGQHKLLLPWGDPGHTVVGQALRAALGGPVKQVVAVTGCRAPEVEQACKAVAGAGAPLTFVGNPGWEAGMYSSVMAGLARLEPDIDAFFVALGDMPMIPSRAYADLAMVARQNPGHIVIPTWEGRRGHPVLLPVNLPVELPPATSDEGLRQVIRRYPDLVVEVPLPYPGVCIDLDTPEEYAQYIR